MPKDLVTYEDFEIYCFNLTLRLSQQLRNDLKITYKSKSSSDDKAFSYKFRSGVYFLYNKNPEPHKTFLERMSESLFLFDKPRIKTKSLAIKDVESLYKPENQKPFKEQLLSEIEFSLQMPGHPIMNLISNF